MQNAATTLADLDSYLTSCEKPLVVVLGPTAAGKTAVSIALAKRYHGAVINADSRQMYQGLQIGTGAPTIEEQQGIEHYLLQVQSPDTAVSVGWFRQQATELIARLHTDNVLPIVCGGSMLYISSIIDDLTLAPKDDTIRTRLEQEYDADCGQTLHARLVNLDPQAAETIHISNKPYLIRALEIMEITGTKRSDTFKEKELRKGINNEQKNSSNEYFILGITRGVPALNQAINTRVDAMIQAGWVQEVQQQLQHGFTAESPGFSSVGYREIAQYLSDPSPERLHETIETIKTKTRRYARRQRSWWRQDERIRWVEAADLLHLL